MSEFNVKLTEEELEMLVAVLQATVNLVTKHDHAGMRNIYSTGWHAVEL